MQKTIDMLAKARELLSCPSCWTQHEIGRTASGNAVSVDVPDVVAYCAIGALTRVLWMTDEYEAASSASDMLAEAACRLFPERLSEGVGDGVDPVVEVNDHPTTSHADVLRMYDTALDTCRAWKAEG